jgi:hypothetical protein
MRASPKDWQVFRNIAAAESEPRPAPASFADALRTLDRLLVRDQTMFPGPREPDQDEFRAHEALYVRARRLGIHVD